MTEAVPAGEPESVPGREPDAGREHRKLSRAEAIAVTEQTHAPTRTPLQLALLPWRRRLHEYVLLTRMHRPIGTLLLLWPVLWALWIGGDGIPDFGVLLVFVLGTFITRSAGCVINDFADRDFDPHVRRTRERPLAARRVSPYEAIWLFVVLMLLAFALVLQLDALTVQMSVIGAVLAASYPFFKRFFPAPQLYLGIAFGWGVPMAFAAQLGEVPRVGWLIFLVTVIWAGVYDTLYAMVDRDDDRHIGIRSTALLFGDMDRVAIGAMQLIMLWGLWLVGEGLGFGRAYWAGLSVAAVLFGWQQWLARGRERDACFEAFLNNNYVGLAIFVGIAAEYALRD